MSCRDAWDEAHGYPINRFTSKKEEQTKENNMNRKLEIQDIDRKIKDLESLKFKIIKECNYSWNIQITQTDEDSNSERDDYGRIIEYPSGWQRTCKLCDIVQCTFKHTRTPIWDD